MRTRLSERTNRGRLAGITVLSLAALCVLMRLVLPDLFLRLTAPVFALGDSLAAHTHSFVRSFGNARILAAKNTSLQAENDVLAVENQTLRDRLTDLTALMGTTSAPRAGVIAGVVTRPPTAPYDVLVLGAGQGEGITPQMEAFGAGGVPLGIIQSTTAHYARVLLYSSPGALTDAWVGESRLPIALKGVGAGAFTAGVSQASGVAVGDLVYLAGPGAVPIGRVAHVSGGPSEPVATLAIQPLLNPYTTTWVEVRESEGSASSTLSTSSGQAQNAVP